MRVSSLTLENFRGFQKLELKLDQLTVLVGVNGSGKTTVLDAIAMALMSAVNNEMGIGRPFSEGWLRLGSSSGSVDLALDGHSIKVAFGPDKFTSVTAALGFNEQQLRGGPLPIFSYYTVSRHAVDNTSVQHNPGRWEAKRAWDGALDAASSNFQSFFHWFREREDFENEQRRNDTKKRDPQLEAVRRAIERMMPGYSDPRVRRPSFEGQDVATKPALVITKNAQELPFDALSEGERTMIALVADIARRAAVARPGLDPLAADGTVLIDELDLHLHPKWQAEALESLRAVFPNLQFIVTTHSPLVLSHVPTGSVRFLQNFALAPLAEPTLGRDPNSLLTDVFHVALRPRDIENALHEIARLLDADKVDDARQKLNALASKVGEHDSDVTRLRSYIELLAS